MIKTILTVSICFITLLLHAQNTDLPGPTPQLQTLPSGSYIIAMDNTLQLNSAGNFNLKAYGLVVYLLNNNVRVKWAIKAGKTKDGIDFTGTAETIKPTLVAAGAAKNFKAGPFVIFASDTTGVAFLIDAFYAANSLTGLNRPTIFRLTADVTNVDIRYDLSGFRPKAAILTDGGNQNIHLAYMTAAAIPAISYATSLGTDLLINCFTFASEPHNGKTGTAVNNAINAIKDFVTKGGNFLAQCDAIDNYENNSLGRFQTTGGIKVTNTIGTNYTYPNPDLSLSQYEGNYDGNAGGSVRDWKVIGTTINNQHSHFKGTLADTMAIGVSVSKHFNGKGGLVFYVGNHDFDPSKAAEINGIRMYMNAFLTPSNTNCPLLTFTPLDAKLTQFSGNTQNGKTKLAWTVSNNESVKQIFVEKSLDGTNFSLVAVYPPSTNTGISNYQYTEVQNVTKTYYRLKLIDKQGSSQSSPVVFISYQESQQPFIRVLNDAGKDDIMISYHSNKKDMANFYVYNSSGTRVYSGKHMLVEGSNIVSIPATSLNQKGIYFVEAINQDNSVLKTKLMKL
ncbi:T9SS type A sorting domain-containing protein [Flavisolibacter tropicus]|uniref:Secretion system C-terminal sorting domain-containing protein n=1 Tax=Flavisolibacter tropicus TaxID=1492898 RepID=A0A172TTS0_9BACT|nr:T9SS type A sorting domain-containing protein [Flavisolibacter tropicus]ANE50386.1 hypothetical protein SY85_07645 [Flavisolibacter tropicus]